ncbi:MAG: DNA-binding protein [Peptoniphilaceae bacterium]|nr:DNA-binding protein [Peptoniphilaceae bacterium]MDY6085403.1 PPC domain-containing DNA-binding protein [Peptoniphilaceae bacterium]
MDYRRFGKTLVCRIDRGEEVLECLEKLAASEHIHLAEVRGLGAVDDFVVGLYDVEKQEYLKNHFTFPAEITNLWGTINTMDGNYYAHLHMSVADAEGHVFGGHLNEAHVAATCEMLITEIDGTVDRYHDDSIGLNLFRFVD